MAVRARPILFIAVIVIALVAGGLYYLSANLNGMVAGIIEEQGSAATQTAVSVGAVDLKLPEASASISGVAVANPQGFAGDAIELGALSVALDASSLTSDTIVIRSINVDGARVNLTQQGVRNNLREILDNLSRMQSGEESTSSEGGKKLIIDRFTLSGAGASVFLPDLDEQRELDLPPLDLRDIGRASNGATGAQVAQQILRPLIDAALKSAAVQTIKGEAGEKINEALGDLVGKFSGKKDER